MTGPTVDTLLAPLAVSDLRIQQLVERLLDCAANHRVQMRMNLGRVNFDHAIQVFSRFNRCFFVTHNRPFLCSNGLVRFHSSIDQNEGFSFGPNNNVRKIVYVILDHGKRFSSGKVYINGLEGFWSYAKQRLAKFQASRRKGFLCT